MTPQKLLHFAEFSFQQISRIWDAQIGKTLTGKQPWQMPSQAVVGGAQAIMCVVWVACFLAHAAFVQEGFVPHQPVMQVLDKAVFAATRQRQRKRPQLACRLTFRLFGQVADDDLDLVKLGVMDKTGAFFETWDSNGQNGCFWGYPFAK